MVQGLSEAQIVERLLRLEQRVRSGDRTGAAKLHAERAGVDFVESQRVVNAL